mmetsp:Transcript_23809/g.35698  ORF Transcript_23809/g.35698 Transcript_23809/m.35698 type:complete len:346 (-) Transcript_23809:341-1378(-)|eukprot:CAMPEP_0167744318 /NCGR_PEP_ID=MMETSP0110_2-20121227/2519_1 /TAXON_ID=629695 /ORGANISM="Gymnochlora sp., Strain CCMP2014" /LENGTH=345 /DNA_ID=CAMNT_0007628815 /DNA_START=59 /DNA_END=1096 /DNA_ORIENTATION=+
MHFSTKTLATALSGVANVALIAALCLRSSAPALKAGIVAPKAGTGIASRGTAAAKMPSSAMRAGLANAAKMAPQQFHAMKKAGQIATQLGATTVGDFRALAQEAVCHLGKAQGNKALLGACNVEWYGPDRPKWLPDAFLAGVPEYLTGEYPGDYGWDALGLSADPDTFANYREAELLHARWAMLGALGCVFPEILNNYYGANIAEPVWWKAGALVLNGESIDYLGSDKFIHASSIIAIAGAQVVLMGGAEAFRNAGALPSGEELDKFHPGGPFNPLKLGKTDEELAELKVKEIKNGRLAMVSMLGFYIQAATTKGGPIQNLIEHRADAANENIFKYVFSSAEPVL